MTKPRDDHAQIKLARRAFWTGAAFYGLIAFEFFYMATPFAAWFYAVYGPGLDLLEGVGPANWTIRFFLPHVSEATSSPLIAVLEPLGAALFFGGLAAFAIGAVQIYRAKIKRLPAVTGGLYRHVRHPQYLALIVSGIGMTLLWPRFLVLIGTVVVIFVYVALARAEERLCLATYPGYAAYMERSGMFLPRGWLPASPLRPAGAAGFALAFAAALAGALGLAFLLRHHAVASLVVRSEPEALYLAVAPIDAAAHAEVAALVRTSPEARALFPEEGALIAYVLPQTMYVAEIPMDLPAGRQFGHSVPRDADPARWKVILARPELPAGAPLTGLAMLREAVNKTALLELHLDLSADAVTATLPPPAAPFYADHQVPLF
ncbi:isoprenylcysteine carboxylmethyltransferase family protein [Salinarimonas sp.]|uniref:methyltransferase family protein n=1 Tax=Salinarimonas sp. TaxID=2766526 RepID=UPI0032D97228